MFSRLFFSYKFSKKFLLIKKNHLIEFSKQRYLEFISIFVAISSLHDLLQEGLRKARNKLSSKGTNFTFKYGNKLGIFKKVILFMPKSDNLQSDSDVISSYFSKKISEGNSNFCF